MYDEGQTIWNAKRVKSVEGDDNWIDECLAGGRRKNTLCLGILS